MGYRVMINGKFYDSLKACLPLEDRGFLYGDGLFETMRACRGQVLGQRRHLKRLFKSIDILGFNLDYNPLQLNHLVKESIEENRLQTVQAYIKIIVTRGINEGKLAPGTAKNSNLIIISKKLEPYPPSLYQKGAKIIRSSIKRTAWGNIAYRHKLLNYFENVFARSEAEKKGALEAIFLTEDQIVLEGATSNIFMVDNNKIYTPPLSYNLLPGITRELVLEICSKKGLAYFEKVFTFSELLKADEVFITNSIMKIMPVTTIESHPVSRSGVGPLTRQLSTWHQQFFSA